MKTIYIKIQTFLLLFVFAHLSLNAQKLSDADMPSVKPTSEMANSDPIYKELRNASKDTSSFSGEFATVKDLVLKKDAAVFRFGNGEIYFLKSVHGRRTGAVFIGEGELSLVPPIESERNSLKFFTDKSDLTEPFSQLVMFFTDKSYEFIKNSPNANISTGGLNAGKARDIFREKENRYRNIWRSNISARILRDIYAPKNKGFFRAFINGRKYSKLYFSIDPQARVEQVGLSNYDRSNSGSWLSFQSVDEIEKNRNSKYHDQRTYDIAHHDIRLVIKGVRLIGKSTVSLSPRIDGQRAFPFSLYGHLRVRRVLDENGDELIFIQEDKDKDATLSVVFPRPKSVDKEFKLTFEYDGTEALSSEGPGNYYLLPRSSWYPNSVTSFADRATFDLRFRYPKQNRLIGVGELVESSEDKDGYKFAHWSTKGVEMAVAGFNYGDFVSHEMSDKATGYELSVFSNARLMDQLQELQNTIDRVESRGSGDDQSDGGRRRSDRLGVFDLSVGGINTSAQAKTILDEAVSSTRLYNHYFGRLPHKRVAMTQQPAGNFGQAWATLVFMPYYAFVSPTHRKQLVGNGNFWREVGPHEVAHQWWGHAVGWKSYRDQWMSEGFSEFSTSLFVQYIYKDQNRFIKYWEDQREQIVNSNRGTKGIAAYKVGPVTQGNRLSSSKAPGGRRVMYPKGAYILHMIRMLMINPKARGGEKDAKFRAMMTDFIKSHYNQDVSTEDFKRIVEKHITPQMDLYQNGSMDWFFNEWVYGTEMPKYEFSYRLDKSGGQTMLNAEISQSEVSDRFVMPVPIYVDYGKGWIELGKAILVGNTVYQLKDIPLPRKPRKVAILALKDVLARNVSTKKM